MEYFSIQNSCQRRRHGISVSGKTLRKGISDSDTHVSRQREPDALGPAWPWHMAAPGVHSSKQPPGLYMSPATLPSLIRVAGTAGWQQPRRRYPSWAVVPAQKSGSRVGHLLRKSQEVEVRRDSEATFCRGIYTQFKREHWIWGRLVEQQNLGKRSGLGWKMGNQGRVEEVRGVTVRLFGRILWTNENICICFSQWPPDLGLEKELWKLLGPRSCGQKAVRYLRTVFAFLWPHLCHCFTCYPFNQYFLLK